MLAKSVLETVENLAHGEPGEGNLYSKGPAEVRNDPIIGPHKTTIDIAGVKATVVLLGLPLKMLQDVAGDDRLAGPGLTVGEKVGNPIPCQGWSENIAQSFDLVFPVG